MHRLLHPHNYVRSNDDQLRCNNTIYVHVYIKTSPLNDTFTCDVCWYFYITCASDTKKVYQLCVSFDFSYGNTDNFLSYRRIRTKQCTLDFVILAKWNVLQGNDPPYEGKLLRSRYSKTSWHYKCSQWRGASMNNVAI